MAIFTDQTLAQSLAVCEGLDSNFDSENVQLCISGIFHSATFPRDFTGDYGQNLSRVYKADDVYYPCKDLPERFRRQCYNDVPGRSHTRELSVIFANCLAIPENDPTKKTEYIRGCYDAASNYLSTQVDLTAEAVVKACRTYADPEFLGYCYAGALRYWFLRSPVVTNTEPARICTLSEREHKPLCYTALGAVIHESYYKDDILKDFCTTLADPVYYNECVTLKPY